ncbi:MAG: gliding motility-associated protein GldE [Bernardetiaceae bacterium]
MDESESFSLLFTLLDSFLPTGNFNITHYLTELLILVILLGASGLISGSEVAFFSISESELEQCQQSKNPRDRRLARLCKDKNTLLATVLVLNNLVNVAIVVISSYLTWQIYGKDNDGWAVVLLTILVTTAIVFFGEVVPKVFAQERSLAFARFTSSGIFVMQKLLLPLTFFLTTIGTWIQQRFARPNIPYITLHQLNRVLEMTMAQEVSEPETQHILRGVINFSSTTARQIMQSRPDIIAADENISFPELIQLITQHGYSRIPTYQKSLDEIKGILYVKDLLNHLDESPDYHWQRLIRRSGYLLHISENLKINQLFRMFQERHLHMAVVTDEYGATRGLITLEDVIEEIVGDIEDEFDEPDEKDERYQKLDTHRYRFSAKVSIHDLCKILDLNPDYFEEVQGESDSLGGLLLELFMKMPVVGEQVGFGMFRFTVEQTDNRRIKSVLIERKPQQLS